MLMTKNRVLEHTAHRSRGLKYSRTSPNDRAGKRPKTKSAWVYITSGSAASQTRVAQRASRAMRWTGTQAHTQVSTHVKWAGVQCRGEQGARDIRTGRETYFVTYYLLTSLPSFLPSLLTYLLAYFRPTLFPTCNSLLLLVINLLTSLSLHYLPLHLLHRHLPLAILPVAHLALAQGARLVGELGRARPQALQRLLARRIT